MRRVRRLPSASVAVRSQSTGDTVRTSTNDRGEFLAQQNPGDLYQLSVSAPGFRSESVNGAVPASGTPAPVNVRLDAGAAADSLTVQAQAAAPQMEARAPAARGGGGGGRGISAGVGGAMASLAKATAALQWHLLRNIPGSDPVDVPAGGTVPKGSSLTLRVIPVADGDLRIVLGDRTISTAVKQGVASDTVLAPFDKTGRVQIQLYFSSGADAKKEAKQEAPFLTIPINIR